jgi:hypothetical protein
VAKAARDASAALDGLEMRKYSALRARREAMKSQLLKSSEADWKAEARNIEEAAAAETKSVDDRYASDLVNARLRVSASEVAATVSQKTDSGMDSDATNEKLRSANADLAGVGSADDAEKGRITAAASARIDALRQASEERDAERVSAYEAEQSKLLERGRGLLPRMRFGLCTALMGNGYYAYDLHARWRGQRWWYPEYDAPLGYPKGGPERLPGGVWRREFDGGTVLVVDRPIARLTPLPE